MSAFVVSKAHIDALVSAGLAPSSVQNNHLSWYHDGERHQLTHSNASEVGQMLWAENVRSVEYRYSPPGREQIYGEGWSDDSSLPGTYKAVTIAPGVEAVEMPEWIEGYSYSPRTPVLKPVEILKAISCLDYQSCEHPEWEQSEAYAFCQALRDDQIERLPGYSEARWSIS